MEPLLLSICWVAEVIAIGVGVTSVGVSFPVPQPTVPVLPRGNIASKAPIIATASILRIPFRTPSTRLALAQPSNYPLYLGDVQGIDISVLIGISPKCLGVQPTYNPFHLGNIQSIDNTITIGVSW